VCKVGHGRLKPLQQLPEAALRRLEFSLRRQAVGANHYSPVLVAAT